MNGCEASGLAQGGVPPPAEIATVVRHWASALRQASYVEMTAARLHDFLTGLVATLVLGLRGALPPAEAGRQAGIALVRARISTPEALSCSLAVLAELPELAKLAKLAEPSELAALPERVRPAAPPEPAWPAAPPEPAWLAEPAGSHDNGRALTTSVLAGFAEGFAVALQQRILAEQEAIQLATKRALINAQLGWQRSQAHLQAVFDGAAIALAVCTLGGHLIQVNRALSEIVGRPATALAGTNLLDLIHPDDRESIRAALAALPSANDRHLRLEKRFIRPDGTTGWAALTVSVVPDATGAPGSLVIAADDITTQRQLQLQLVRQAHHDGLTGLPNRERLYQQLTETLRTATPHSRIGMCFVDLDEFKAINDTLGHGMGDRLLVAVAARLRDSLDTSRHFLARVGGDEFAVIVRDSQGVAELAQLAERMLAAVATPINIDGYRLTVSASIGVTEELACEADPQRLLRVADATMYLAKADGRNRWVMYDPGRHAEQLHRYEMIGELPQALNRREFLVHYQPIVSLSAGDLRGAEALLRWQRPRTGLVSPNSFIPVAEQSGLIVSLGRWVLREACTQAAAWRRPGTAELFISVNVSMRQCAEPGLVTDVRDALAHSGLAANRLQIELTETAVMLPSDDSVSTLRVLADLGVRIVIDDFGVGYSNLAHLRRLPIHGVKLAGAFMAGIRSPGVDQVDERIVETIIRLAHLMRLSVTAEGVETAAQAARLAALGCDLAQGWHFGAAGPASAIEQWQHPVISAEPSADQPNLLQRHMAKTSA